MTPPGLPPPGSPLPVCIVGGGPAGMMLGLLLARAGIETLVLEKHADFLRDFRGDTVHPSTLEILHDLGLLERFLRRPHQRVDHITAVVGGVEIPVADFTHLPTHARYVAFMPQWEFLDFLKEEARALPTFHLAMETEVTGLTMAAGAVTGAVTGVTAVHAGEARTIAATLVVGADGRNSVVRTAGGLPVEDLGAPIDVLWLRVPRGATDPDQVFGRFDAGRIFILLNRGDYWQCAFVIAKGTFAALQSEGLPAFRDTIAALAPFLHDRVDTLVDWEQVKLLTVRVDRLVAWARPGLLCIGDAAHAMSPVGGVGINLAIQDAVATANLLVPALKRGGVTLAELSAVQRRRAWPTRVIQAAQVFVHRRVLTRVLARKDRPRPPLLLRLFARVPWLRRIPARVIGLGVRPERPRDWR